MTDKQIMIDGVDVNSLYSDQIACMNRYEVARLFIKTVEQLKAKEQECNELKNAYARLNSLYNDNCNFTDKLEKTLTEIKEIVTLDKTSFKYAGSTISICDDILIKISEVEE